MTKQLSSLELHFLLNELDELKSSRIDKIYNLGNEEIYIQFHKSGTGKKILRIILGKAIFFSGEKSSDEKPSHFCAVMRKHLDGKFLNSIRQIKSERILELVFKSKDDEKKAYIEIFGKGNVILCNNDNIIIEALLKHKFRDRSILPKQEYQYPRMQYNLFGLDKNNILELLKNSKKDKLITLLATELGLGGVYSEETCLLAKIDKNMNPKQINDEGIQKILGSIKKIVGKKTNPQIVYEENVAVDVTPVDLEFYKKHEKKRFPSFNEALDYYFMNEAKLISKKESKYEKQINELKRIIEEQEATLESLKVKENENREKAELIYNNYKLISEILEEINKAKEKYSWEEIKKRIRGNKIVKDIDVKEKKIVVEL